MNDLSVISELKFLLEKRAEHIACSSVEQVSAGGDWVVEGDRLRNLKSDYFSVSRYEIERDESRYLIEQNDCALVLLLVANHCGQQVALINTRFEPGLIGRVNYTSTIQSTPSNYKREHGGKPTPYIEVAGNPTAYGAVVYEGEQFDWGEHYVLKKKKYLIVDIEKTQAPPEGFVWVTYELLQALLGVDHLITNDLRVAAVMLLGKGRVENPVAKDVSLPLAYKKLPLDLRATDSQGVEIRFFQSKSQGREVTSWVQPLLVMSRKMQIKLTYTFSAGEKLFAVQRSTQVGLLGREVWFPFHVEGARSKAKVSTCAEGGRFWEFPIEIEISLLDEEQAVNTLKEDISWKNEQEFMAIVATPLESSLELRMAASLALREAV